jgi:23S rRNA pseudouridine1911/1915/1917 synthase
MKTRLWNFAELFPLRHVRAPDAPALRLDAALGEALPGSGLRARRRLWASCCISVNGRACAPGYLTRAGDILEAEPLGEIAFRGGIGSCPEGERADHRGISGALRIVARTADYIVFDKASGLHSAHIAGSPHASLESLARNMFPERVNFEKICSAPAGLVGKPLPRDICLTAGRTCLQASQSEAVKKDAGGLYFLTRLDRATSGLVVAALNAQAAARFRCAERNGLTRKSYLAVVQGRLTAPLLLAGRLLTDRRAVTAALPESTPDQTRHCRVLPLPRRPIGEGLEAVSLVRVDIMRGARHQVRAALAAAGFPLCGDVLYGGSACPFRAPDASRAGRSRPAFSRPAGQAQSEIAFKPEAPEFYLHHARLESPELGAQSLPVWAGLFAAPDDLQSLLLMPMPDVSQ